MPRTKYNKAVQCFSKSRTLFILGAKQIEIGAGNQYSVNGAFDRVLSEALAQFLKATARRLTGQSV